MFRNRPEDWISGEPALHCSTVPYFALSCPALSHPALIRSFLLSSVQLCRVLLSSLKWCTSDHILPVSVLPPPYPVPLPFFILSFSLFPLVPIPFVFCPVPSLPFHTISYHNLLSFHLCTLLPFHPSPFVFVSFL